MASARGGHPSSSVRRRIGATAIMLLGVGVAVLAAVLISPTGNGSHHVTLTSLTRHRAVTGSTTAVPFSPTSVWNAPLPADAPLSAASATYTSDLVGQVMRFGSWVNTSSYSTPVYVVPADQPTVPVILDTTGGDTGALAAAFRSGVPIPPNATPAAGTDEHMVVWQPGRDTMWEFWHARNVGDTWHARWGGKMTDVSFNPGYFTSPTYWGATATSLPLLGGLMRISELQSGHINHALALAIPDPRAGRYVFPAQRTDGSDPSPEAIPEGTEFRLDPRINVASLHLPPVAQMMALAAQKYGIIVRDHSGAVSFYGEAPTSGAPDPYSGKQGLFGGLTAAQVLRQFPWHDLEAIAPRTQP